MSVRTSGRAPDELRPLDVALHVNRHAEGSCRIRLGDTEVLCTASVEDRVPPFLHGRGEGWVTAEYGMLPRSTHDRTMRDRNGRTAGRTHEIQRLVVNFRRKVNKQKSKANNNC